MLATVDITVGEQTNKETKTKKSEKSEIRNQKSERENPQLSEHEKLCSNLLYA